MPNKTVLPKVTSSEKSEVTQREAREIAAQISFKVRIQNGEELCITETQSDILVQLTLKGLFHTAS